VRKLLIPTLVALLVSALLAALALRTTRQSSTAVADLAALTAQVNGAQEVRKEMLVMGDAMRGFLLDTTRRLWNTSNGGSSWKERISAGTQSISGISFGSSSSGYLSVESFGDDFTNAYILHTSDGGQSWRPQAISPGVVGAGGIVAGDAGRAFSLVKARGGAAASRQLFATASGGDGGMPSPLTIKTKPTKFTKKSLKSAKGQVTVSGTLAGAIGGEQVTISMRAVGGTTWARRTVTAGANGGSFSATFTVKNAAVFVAQWAGDSGRIGEGTPPLLVKVTK
jgi:photosystem II stability/assembly factor-like uncharacterized protein